MVGQLMLQFIGNALGKYIERDRAQNDPAAMSTASTPSVTIMSTSE